jgi:phosphatidylserine/phosphatidylglycerophosphate/cardiolipin synthase-like enzyme
MSVDGRVCAVGSANFDVTAAYWESELLLVVDGGAGLAHKRKKEMP